MPEHIVYKISPRADWLHATSSGVFCGSADDVKDGFIHLSAASQVQRTLETHFRSKDDLLLIAFDARAFGDALRWEVSRGGQLFPHLYGRLRTSDALWQRSLNLRPDGIPEFDAAWLTC